MNTSRIFLQRVAPNMAKVGKKAFSTECAPAQKLKAVFEEYRRQNFDDEIPSRFRKHMIKAIEEPDHQTFQVDNLNRILDNIGRKDAHLSNDELSALLREAGVPSHERSLSISKMMELM
ncbi:expressed unknown protein [Seminavis robusta]|uniref:Uncharacterized protein n=1 Tax=Seminavis robusta TaxID=568900 RepID=A0A9N8ERH5_9STRA|nr:expressed unknown protein [Seminavis robusta]|eukprot:Sro1881_g303280.1 n/a (119) ;mRNA; f:5583-6040